MLATVSQVVEKGQSCADVGRKRVIQTRIITRFISESLIMRSTMPQLCFALISICLHHLYARNTAQAVTPLDTNAAVADIIRDVVARHGGQEALSRWRCGSIRYTAEGDSVPLNGIATTTETFEFPGSFRRSVTVKSAGGSNLSQMLFIINPKESWMIINGGQPVANGRAFADRDHHSFADVISVARLEDFVENITKGEVVEFGGSPLPKLTVSVEQAKPIEYFISIKTGLLAMLSKRGTDPTTGRELRMVTSFSDYKTVDGSPVPMTFSSTSDGRPVLSVRIESVEFRESHPPDTFELPTRI